MVADRVPELVPGWDEDGVAVAAWDPAWDPALAADRAPDRAPGWDEDAAAEVALPLGEGVAGWVAEKGEPVLITDVEKDFRFDERESGMRNATRSLVCAPLVSKGNVLGVVSATRPSGGAPFNEGDLDLLTNIADQAAVCIENARLFAQLREKREVGKEDA